MARVVSIGNQENYFYIDKKNFIQEWWENEKYRRLQGTYPVLFISFAGVKENSYEGARESICRTIEEQYNRHDFLLDGNLLNEKEKAFV